MDSNLLQLDQALRNAPEGAVLNTEFPESESDAVELDRR